MIGLIQNEWMKIFKRPGTFLMIAILMFSVAIFAAVSKFEESGQPEVDQNWAHNLAEENNALKNQEKGTSSIQEKQFFKKQITMNQYRIQHHFPPQTSYHVWEFVNDASKLIELSGLFTIIIAAGIVANEFNWGTIKLLLIRPNSRVKILFSKYLTILLFGLFLLFILFVFSIVLGITFFGMVDQNSTYLNYYNGKVTEQNIVIHLLIIYGLSSINMVMLATMAFMISSVFRSSSLAIGLALFFMFTGEQLTVMLSLKFSWAKYILFANTDLSQYFEGNPIVEGMTLPFSIMMLVIYFLLFQFLTFYIFNKRDVI